MKSYGQLCAVARALDVVGDRWTLLIVRELLISGSLRFGELERGLPGIAPNLLAQRLRDLEAEGVIERDPADGARVARYRLTPRGAALDGVVRELLKWGAPTVPQAPAGARFQMHWLSMPARALLRDSAPDRPPERIRFGDVADGFDVTAGGERIEVGPVDAAASPDAIVAGPGPALVALVQGALPLDEAHGEGVELEGSRAALERVLPSGR